jgi:hypothetical protein
MTGALRCGHVPFLSEAEVSWKPLYFANHGKELQLYVPELTVDQLTNMAQQMKKQRKAYLASLPVGEIVDVIDQAVCKWLDPAYEKRKLAMEWLPAITGYHPEMITLFLPRYLRRFRKESLLRMIDEDFANPLVLDEFRPRKAGGWTRAYGPDFITQIYSGNVPALPLWSIASALLLKSSAIGKVSSAEPLFPVLFAKTLEEISPSISQCLAMIWWKGGEETLERVCYQHSEAVVAYGSERTIEAIASKVPPAIRLVSHSHKVSFGVVTQECLDLTKARETAKLAAYDASWFDQQGCLSPHVFFVERGAKVTPKEFAQMLAQEMANFEQRMPRAVLSPEESQMIRQLRAQVEFESYNESSHVQLLQSPMGTAWTVIYRETQEFPLSPLNRVVSVVPYDREEQLTRSLHAVRPWLQTAGIACPPEKFRSLIRLLGDSGVNRICALGHMPQPEAGWHHDGRFALADLVRWCDVESSTEHRMEDYDPNRN